MLTEIWEQETLALFVSVVPIEPSPTLEFHHLHPRDRFWELLELGSITPARVISKEERKAMAEGHARGNITDPVRQIFLQKKTSQILRAGIGITYLRSVAGVDTEKHKDARPSQDDVRLFLDRCRSHPVKILGFVMDAGMFAELFAGTWPGAGDAGGKQGFTIHGAEVWLMGSSQAALKGEALLAQEDLYLAFGERLDALRTSAARA
jgi:G:T/U-mismatch repair DNA glycosylase